jgi:hypothetical protein
VHYREIVQRIAFAELIFDQSEKQQGSVVTFKSGIKLGFPLVHKSNEVTKIRCPPRIHAIVGPIKMASEHREICCPTVSVRVSSFCLRWI